MAKRAVFVHINRFNVAFLEQLNVTQQGISFHQKVVFIATDGRSLCQKLIPQRASKNTRGKLHHSQYSQRLINCLVTKLRTNKPETKAFMLLYVNSIEKPLT